jgi:hypothetical protein
MHCLVSGRILVPLSRGINVVDIVIEGGCVLFCMFKATSVMVVSLFSVSIVKHSSCQLLIKV